MDNCKQELFNLFNSLANASNSVINPEFFINSAVLSRISEYTKSTAGDSVFIEDEDDEDEEDEEDDDEFDELELAMK
jgi:hypothetical protein